MIISRTFKRAVTVLIFFGLLGANLWAFLPGQKPDNPNQRSKTDQLLPGNRRVTAVTNCLPGEIVVKLKKGTKAAAMLDAQKPGEKIVNVADLRQSSEIGPLISKHSITEVKSVFGRAKRETKKTAPADLKTKRDNLFRWCHLHLPKEADLEKVLKDFRAHADVEIAEPVYDYHLHDVIDPPITGLPDGTTDPDIGQQWHLNATHTQQAWN